MLNFKMTNLMLLTLILSPVLAFAAGGEHHEGAVPVKTIIYQVINVGAIVAGLIYFLKDGVREAFKERQATYLVAAQKAEAARKAAEAERSEMAQRLSHLENTASESITRARAEAVDMKKQIITEAENLSRRLKEDAAQTAQAEVMRAKKEIRESLIKQATEAAKEQIEHQVSAADHERLQSNFIQNIQVVQK